MRFNCDYSEGAHPRILNKLIETNLEQTVGYGDDDYCRQAAELIKARCRAPEADVHFLVGGTQTNLAVISACLRPHQGAVTADTGHINTHETGAIEATGHKVLTVASADGKITAAQVQEVYDAHYGDDSREHTVQPKLVYISNPTEVGTIYTREELTELSRICRKNGLILYMDGARLGYAICAEGSDLDLPAFAELCDVFYIGGTKTGALFGEALVITDNALKQDFRYIIKQKGGLLAKGRLLGLQFITLFEDDLYFDIARHTNEMAGIIKEACIKKGYRFLTESVTNQQFPIMPDRVLNKLKEKYEYSFWQKIGHAHSAVRFCTSWATEQKDVEQLAEDILNS
ncbi:L-threonine aldolase [Sporobacter termitidis DSM 10068]|uniref:L-threonine aldolase n=1 Tax=Sporobacter termitidis DSM 10068 TaxID=1123282 RepID=A0A1M5Z200_9FIRM|nr:L-threonine aldolase [Sporobacter termitidis DSM 10068]